MEVKTPSKRPDLSGLEAHALTQGGYFDRADAIADGLDDDDLSYHARTGRFERVHHGVYRLRTAPIAPWDDLLRAWVWTNYRGVISHESALALYRLSDVMPSVVHVTVPPSVRRVVPTGAPYVLHHARFEEGDVGTHEGMRVTTPARTIVDAAAGGTAPDQIERAVHEAISRGLTTPSALRTAAARRYPHKRTAQPLIERAIHDATTTLSHDPAA